MDTVANMNRILVSNIMPSHVERASLICGMNELNAQCRFLQQQVAAVEARLALFRSALSSIRQIPLEILGEIFMYVAESPKRTNLPLEEGMPWRGVVVNLGLVCKRWREAALLTRGLWAVVELSSTIQSRAYPDGNEGKILGWLKHAGNAPKFLHARNTALDSQDIINLLTEGPVFERARFECRSLQSLLGLFVDVNCVREEKQPEGDPNGAKEVTLLPWDQVKHLELDFQHVSWTFEDDDLRVPDDSFLEEFIPHSVTSLSLHVPPQQEAFRKFLIGGVPSVDVPATPLGISRATLGRLTSLEVSCDWDGQHLIQMLQHCQELVKLTSIRVRTRGAPSLATPPAGEPVLLPKLKTLRLRGHDQLKLLHRLQAPGLTTFDVDFSENTRGLIQGDHASLGDASLDTDRAEDMLQFSEESGVKRSLTTLRISHAVFSAESELRRIVLNFPCVSHLILDDVIFDQRRFWEAIRASIARTRKRNENLRRAGKGSEPALLHLKTLDVLTVDDGGDVEGEKGRFYESLCAMLQERTLPCVVNLLPTYRTQLSENHFRAAWKTIAEQCGSQAVTPEAAKIAVNFFQADFWL